MADNFTTIFTDPAPVAYLNVDEKMRNNLLAIAVIMFIEHVGYSIIWLKPVLLSDRIRGKNPVECVHAFLVSQKCMQACAVGMYYLQNKSHYILRQTFAEIVTFGVTLGLLMIAIGQLLNFSVYKAIKKEGVYYGVRFGYHIPWVTSFPYNLKWLRHPQYIGSLLTWFGLAFIALSVFEYNFHCTQFVLGICVIQILNYGGMMYIENIAV